MTTRKRTGLVLGAVLAAAAWAAPAPAPAADLAALVANHPASTLLLPYFEVNLAPRATDDTLFSVNNASASATLAHVTVWSDLAVPVFGFDVYLTGYDAQRFSMRSLLAGQFPVTASDGQDPRDDISPQGPVSQDINFASCTGVLPLGTLTAEQVAGIRDALTGRPSALFAGNCAGVRYPRRRARGYVTVDVSNACTALNPNDPGYFLNGGSGIAGNRNILWGDYYYIRPATLTTPPFHVGAPLVSVRTDVTDPQLSVPGEYTFYGAAVGWTAIDNRQPLGAQFGARFLRTPQLRSGASLVVWRDPKVKQAPFTCGTYPSWFGLDMELLGGWDEQEEAFELASADAFPAATQIKPVAALAPPTAAGWLYMNFGKPVAGATAPPEDFDAGQAWVFVIQDARGRFSNGSPAVMIEGAAEQTHSNPGFEFLP